MYALGQKVANNKPTAAHVGNFLQASFVPTVVLNFSSHVLYPGIFCGPECMLYNQGEEEENRRQENSVKSINKEGEEKAWISTREMQSKG